MGRIYLGKDAKLYHGTAGADLASMSELTCVRDVTVTLETGEAESVSRASKWRKVAPTFNNCTLEFEMAYEPDDSGWQAIKDAWLNQTEIELAALDGDKADSAQGIKGTFHIMQFSVNQPLEEALTVSVTARPSGDVEWVTAGGA